MTEIIDNIIKENPLLHAEESNMKCPICNNILYKLENRLLFVCDGNLVFQCENEVEHKFWVHPCESSEILHLNKNASETDWTSEQDYILKNGSWVKYNKSYRK